MMALKVFGYAEATGHRISLKDGKLKVNRGKTIKDDLKTAIISQKNELVEMLNRDKKAKDLGLLIGLPGTIYTNSINRHSSVYIEQINDVWVAWRETYKPGDGFRAKRAISYRTIVESEDFDYVLQAYKRYIDYVSSKI